MIRFWIGMCLVLLLFVVRFKDIKEYVFYIWWRLEINLWIGLLIKL